MIAVHARPASTVATLVAIGMLLAFWPVSGRCWGDRGHEIVGLIAFAHLQPAVRAKVTALLAEDSSRLTPTTGIAAESTWADKYRDSDRDGAQVRYRRTRNWHFVDIEIDAPDLAAACHGHPGLRAGTQASQGPAEDCIVDKIDQFRHELGAAGTSPDERRLALQFLLHLIGDLHQPLHAADRHDKGGNDLWVRTVGDPRGNLHHYWDTVFVERLGEADAVAARLDAQITERQRREWSSGSPSDWARESFDAGRDVAYGPLSATRGVILLDAAYESAALEVIDRQLARAGVRLAWVLNEALR